MLMKRIRIKIIPLTILELLLQDHPLKKLSMLIGKLNTCTLIRKKFPRSKIPQLMMTDYVIDVFIFAPKILEKKNTEKSSKISEDCLLRHFRSYI